LREEKLLKRSGDAKLNETEDIPLNIDEDSIDEFYDEAPDSEIEKLEEEVIDQASAARTIAELEIEIESLKRLEDLALKVHRSGTDKKWEELSALLQGEGQTGTVNNIFDAEGLRRKLIIFTEHRDTLNYLTNRIRTLLGRAEAVVTIHGSMGREERHKTQEAFTQDKNVLILVATDAAGEGINLQRAHLMVNYDLPWNPNRIEQRFGRIHRIGQTEVCHLWNLVASETREGEVYHRLLTKLEQQRESLGGSVFDVLGKCFNETSLRELLIDAIRYGDKPEIKAKLTETIDKALDYEHIRQLIEERALTHEVLDAARVQKIREEMERAEARRFQPHYIASFFREAFRVLGGAMHEREPKRYEITHTPTVIRNRDRIIGIGEPVLKSYERITFEKNLISISGKLLASFVCPGHPLLDSTIDLVLERYRELLKRGSTLVDPYNSCEDIRVLFYLEHSIQDARMDRSDNRRIVSRQMQFVEMDEKGNMRNLGYAPYLDYRPITSEENESMKSILESQEWLYGDLDSQAVAYAAEHIVPLHLDEVRTHKEERIRKTMEAVKDRLTKEINYWDHRSEQLKLQESAGKPMAKINSDLARQRADDLEARLRQRMQELEEERYLSPLPPVVIGGALVVPQCLLEKLTGKEPAFNIVNQAERERIDRLAVAAVMEMERKLGRIPREMDHGNPGYDIESKDPDTNRLFFIEVKGKSSGSSTITVSKTQILTALNKYDDFILAIVEVDGEKVAEPRYIYRPFRKEPDFGVTSVNYDLEDIFARGGYPV
ncbi:MAG: DUF3883 domain-containing protein, partial [Firmicutes bacterium]|nr:DUF3883 domain-containing protein [Bacillota bacterium]